MLDKKSLKTASLISVGLVLSVIHQPDQPFIKYLFLPVIGNLLVIMGSALYLLRQKHIDFGSKWLWIPLALISASIILRPFYSLITGQSQWGMVEEWSSAGYGIALFSLYLTGRSLGTRIFSAFIPAIIIASIYMVYYGLTNPGIKTGGIISITNYDIIIGFLIFGLVVSAIRYQWWLSAIVAIGLYFSGADEGLFVSGIMVGVVIIRQDWSKKILLPIGALILVFALTFPFGIPQRLYHPAVNKIEQVKIASTMKEGEVKEVTRIYPNITPIITQEYMTKEKILDEATGYRWLTYWKLSPIKPLGYGYNINHFYRGIPHNVILIIIEQIGILAALSWLWVVLYGIFKTKWKYAWIAVLALSVLDHFIWTQAGLWMWALAGVSSNTQVKDLIYRNEV